MADPAFFITGDAIVEPTALTGVLREIGSPKLMGAVHDTYEWLQTIPGESEWILTVPDNYVLLMMGFTDDLLRGCKEAREAGIAKFSAKDCDDLKLIWRRIPIDGFRVGTVIALGSANRTWLAGQPDFLSGEKWKWRFAPGLEGWPNTRTVSIADSSDPRELPYYIRWIKEQDAS